MRVVAAAWLTTICACELVLPIHETEDGAPDVAADVPADVVLDAAPEASVNALVSPGFDGTGGGCGFPWQVTNTKVTLTRPDAGVCRVCVTARGIGVTQHVTFPAAQPATLDVEYGLLASKVVSTSQVLVQLDVHLRDGGRQYWPQPQIATTVNDASVSFDLFAPVGKNALDSIDFNVLDEDNDASASAGVCFDLVAPFLDVSSQ